MQQTFAWLSFAVSISASAIFIYDTIKGKIKPQRISWPIWAALSATYFTAALRTDGAVLFTLAELIGPAAIFAISLKFGIGGGQLIRCRQLDHGGCRVHLSALDQGSAN